MYQRGPILWLALRSKLHNKDIIDQVTHFDKLYQSAIALQRFTRGWLSRMRHAHMRHILWPVLVRELEASCPGLVDSLVLYAAVRQEWTSDPAAWLHTLGHMNGAHVIRQIHRECVAGLW